MNEQEQLILKITTRHKALKTRIKVASKEELAIWQTAFEKLSVLGDKVLPFLKEMSVEELRDFDKLYNMVDLIHDDLRTVGNERRREEAEILETMVEDNLTVLEGFLNREKKETNPNPAIRKVAPKEEIIISRLNTIKSNLDYFDISLIFIVRDNPNLTEEFLTKIRAAKKELDDEYKLIKKEMEFSIPTDELLERWYEKVNNLSRKVLELYKAVDSRRSKIYDINKTETDYKRGLK